MRRVTRKAAKQKPTPEQAFFVINAGGGQDALPSRSWWVGLPRPEWLDRIDRERPRMSRSRWEDRLFGGGVDSAGTGISRPLV